MPTPKDALITQLSSDSAVTRESAIARLTVIGARAVDRLVEVTRAGASPTARAAALTALERIGDRRGLAAALPLLSDPDAGVALAAIALAGAFVRGRHGVAAVDRLTALAVDESRPASIRAAALDALKALGAATIKPLVERLSDDPALRFAEPAAMRTRIAVAAKAPLTALLTIVEEIRERERAASRDERAQWLEVRGDAHALLARRGSTIALYDLRDAFEQATAPLPAGFVAAAAGVGNASCLEPIAAAYARAKDVYWKKALAGAFSAIMKRGRLTRRNVAIKKIAQRWPAAAEAFGVSTPSRTTPPRSRAHRL